MIYMVSYEGATKLNGPGEEQAALTLEKFGYTRTTRAIYLKKRAEINQKERKAKVKRISILCLWPSSASPSSSSPRCGWACAL